MRGQLGAAPFTPAAESREAIQYHRLPLIDYHDSVLAHVFEQDRRLIEFNASKLAKLAVTFGIPVVLSTIGVEMGVREPTISAPHRRAPDVEPIDRH